MFVSQLDATWLKNSSKKRGLRPSLLGTSALMALVGPTTISQAASLNPNRLTKVEGVDFQIATDVQTFSVDPTTGQLNLELTNGVTETFNVGEFRVIGESVYLNPAALPVVPGTPAPSLLSNSLSSIGATPLVAGATGLAGVVVLAQGTSGSGSGVGTSSGSGSGSTTFGNTTPTGSPPIVDAAAVTGATASETNAGTLFTIPASDPDGDSLTFSLDATSIARGYVVDGSGNVSNPNGPDFEVGTPQTITVSVSDGNGNTVTHSVDLAVTNVDEAPEISSAAAKTVSESATGGLMQVVAADPEGTSVTYALSGAGATDFAIDGAGQITYTGGGAIPTGTHTFDVEVTSNGLTTTQTFTLTVTDDNDAPTFTSGATNSVNENLPISTVLYDADATDPNGDSITFSLSGVDAGDLQINANGEVTKSSGSLDHEDKDTYTFNVIATDNGSPILASTHAVVVSIADLNEAPAFTTSASASVAEREAGVIFTAGASDPENDSLTFALTGGNSADFTINPTSGGITYTGAGDLSIGTYTFTIQASDAGFTTTQPFTLTVTDTDDAPAFASATLSPAGIDENDTGTLFTTTATDPDGETPLYTLTGTHAANFQIDASGNVSAASGFGMTPATYNFNVVATDPTNSALLDTQAITLVIADIDEAPTFAATAATYSVDENTTGTLFTHTATDPDGETPTYAITGTDQTSFSIDALGQVTFTGGTLDHETKDAYSFTIKATDPTDGALTDTVAITFNVNDINEAPTIGSGGVAAVNENAANTSVVYTATASDVDDLANGDVTFSLTGTDAALFSIGSTSGQVTLQNPNTYDHETKDQYDFNVVATDGGSPALTYTQAVVLSVTDLNEAPVFTDGAAQTISLTPSSTGTLGMADATDVDDPAQTLTYALTAGTPSPAALNTFEIDGSGNLTLKSGGPALATGTYTLTAKVTDNGTGALTDTQTITINVNASEIAPLFAGATTNQQTSDVDENSTTPLTAITTSVSTGTNVVYALTGNDAGLFSYDNMTGKLTYTGVSPNHESPHDSDKDGIYEVNIKATNAAGTAVETFQLTINDLTEVATPALTYIAGTDTYTVSDTGYLNADQDALTSLVLTERGAAGVDDYLSWLGPSLPGTATTILTYGYNSAAKQGLGFTGGVLDSISGADLFAWTAAEMTAIDALLAQIENVANIDLQKVALLPYDAGNPVDNDGSVDIMLGKTNKANAGFGAGTSTAAFAWSPSTGLFNDGVDDVAIGGDALFILDGMYEASTATEFGSIASGETFQRSTVLHEILHSLGIQHPFDGATNGVNGVTEAAFYPSTWGGHLSDEADNVLETIMTYHRPFGDGTVPDNLGVEDIRALQHKYGSNTTANTGDDTYTYDTAGSFVYDTIWDGGGVDTLVHAGTANSIIDLRDGEYSAVGALPPAYNVYDLDDDTAISAAETASAAAEALYNVGIAHGVTIENATGGSGNDTIRGNEAPNRITGNAGTDNLTGNGAADVFVFAAGWGTDTITDFTAGEDHLEFASALSGSVVNVSDDGTDTTLTIGSDSVVLTGVTGVTFNVDDEYFFA